MGTELALSSDKTERLGTQPISRLLLEFSVPAIVGVIVQTLYGIIDAVFVGHGVGALGLAVITVATPLMTVMLAVAMLVGVGGNAMVALVLGSGKKRRAIELVGRTYALLIIVSLVTTAVGLVFLEPILLLSGATPDVLPLAKRFCAILLVGFVFQCVGYGMSNFIRTAGMPLKALVTMIVGTLVNIVLGYLFVLVFKWGMDGAAWATVIAWAVSAVAVQAVMRERTNDLRLHYGDLKIEWGTYARILLLGLAPFALQLGTAAILVIENQLLMYYGALDPLYGSDGALAVMSVLGKIAALVLVPAAGINMGLQPILGYNFGARDVGRVKKAFMQALAIGIALTTLLWLTVMIFPGQYSLLFGLPASLVEPTSWGLRAYLVFCPIIPLQIIGANYFQATGQAIKATLLTLTRQIFFLVPVLLLAPLFLPRILPWSAMQAFFFSTSISDILSAILVGAFMVREWKRLDKLLTQGWVDTEHAGMN